jgi:hypothetical protein
MTILTEIVLSDTFQPTTPNYVFLLDVVDFQLTWLEGTFRLLSCEDFSTYLSNIRQATYLASSWEVTTFAMPACQHQSVFCYEAIAELSKELAWQRAAHSSERFSQTDWTTFKTAFGRQ